MKAIINEVREWIWSIRHGDLVPLIFIIGGIYVILAISATVYTAATNNATFNNYVKSEIVEHIEVQHSHSSNTNTNLD